MWVTAAIPESIAWLVKDASQFTLTVPARPDKTLTIRKWTLLPGVDAATRTLQLRLEVDNADEALNRHERLVATQHRQRTDAAHSVTSAD